MRVVYVDVLFMSNLAVNYLLLVLTARASGVYTSRLRLLAGGALGALFAVFLYFPALPWWAALLAKALLCAAIAVVAFNREPLAVVGRICLVFVALSFAFAGGIIALTTLLGSSALGVSNGVPYFNLSLRMLLGATLMVYCVLGLIFGRGGMQVKHKTVEMELVSGQNTVKLKGFTDTGNLLRDPISGKRIIVVSPSVAAGLFPNAAGLLREKGGDPTALFAALSQSHPGIFRLLPCKTAGGMGMMVAARMDKIVLDGRVQRGFLVGVAAQEIDTQGGCRAMVGV